jgi:hypothetical protein
MEGTKNQVPPFLASISKKLFFCEQHFSNLSFSFVGLATLELATIDLHNSSTKRIYTKTLTFVTSGGSYGSLRWFHLPCIKIFRKTEAGS